MSVLFTFPGQGSQSAGMLHRLPDHPETARSLDEACAVLGRDPLALDAAEALASTVSVQLALLVAGVAMARVLAARGAEPDMVAGMSVGAFPAAVVAGALDYADALRLVALRAHLMETAFPQAHGMAALVGLGLAQVEELVDRIHSASAPLFVANVNAEQQIVVAGAEAALRKVAECALAEGAARCERLAVSVPSHCPLLQPAAEALRRAIAAVSVRRPRIAWLGSSTARASFDPGRIAEELAGNCARRVNWRDTARLAWERGARLAVEMPSGDVLTGLTQPVFADGLAVCTENNRVATVCALVASEKAHGVG